MKCAWCDKEIEAYSIQVEIPGVSNAMRYFHVECNTEMKHDQSTQIAWKVIWRKSRLSCVMGAPTVMFEVREEIALKYEQGKVVTAHPNTAGILCFDTEHSAMQFIRDYEREHNRYIKSDEWIAVRVRPIGEPCKDVKLCNFFSTGEHTQELLQAFRRGTLHTQGITGNAPEGTVCYKAVEVLE